MKRSIIALTCVVASAIALPAAASPAYRIDAICQLSKSNSRVTDINNKGQVVGFTDSGAHDYTSFVWQNGQIQTLQSLGGNASVANAINEKGQVTGYSTRTTFGYEVAAIWQDGAVAAIGNLGGANSFGSDINESGIVVGYSQLSTFDSGHAYTCSDGVIRDSGLPSLATGINDAGEVVATREGGTSFIWQNDAMTDLGNLGGGRAYSTRINNASQVVGYSFVNDTYRHGFLWQNGNMTDLGSGSEQYSMAWDINERGLIVGDYGWNYHACTWQNGLMTDLNAFVAPDSGWTLTQATAVNDLGQIAGKGIYNGEYWAYVMTPVPEPSSILAILSGFSGLAFCFKKRTS